MGGGTTGGICGPREEVSISRAIVWPYVGGEPREPAETVWRRRSLLRPSSGMLLGPAMEFGRGREVEVTLGDVTDGESGARKEWRVKLSLGVGFPGRCNICQYTSSWQFESWKKAYALCCESVIQSIVTKNGALHCVHDTT